jgi:hypothetical protein
MKTLPKIQKEPAEPQNFESSAAWWSARRWRYNVGLLAAGMTAFVSYLVVLSIFSDAFKYAEVTVFTTAFQAAGYLVCVAIANVCYQLGPLSEHWFRPENPTAYRQITFALGFWFSVALPFSIPALLIIRAFIYPHESHAPYQ